MSKPKDKAHPVERVQRENAVFRDADIDGLITLANERDPAAAQHLRRMFVQAVRKGEKPDGRLVGWIADRLYRVEWEGVQADVALGIKPGSRPPEDSQRRFEKACEGNDIVRRVSFYAELEPHITKCIERVADDLNISYDKAEETYYAYRAPENTSKE